MIGFNTSPPALPTNEAITTALTLLQVAADPKGTRSRLDELVEQMKAVHSAMAEHDAARKAAEAAQRRLADVNARDKKLAEEQAAVVEEQTRLAVTSSAFTAREQSLTARENELVKREGEIAAKEKALAARVASYRSALA
jgi:uncharacterized protein (DUF3084 family)